MSPFAVAREACKREGHMWTVKYNDLGHPVGVCERCLKTKSYMDVEREDRMREPRGTSVRTPASNQMATGEHEADYWLTCEELDDQYLPVLLLRECGREYKNVTVVRPNSAGYFALVGLIPNGLGGSPRTGKSIKVRLRMSVEVLSDA